MDSIGVVTGSKAGIIEDGKWGDDGVKQRENLEEKEITYGNIW